MICCLLILTFIDLYLFRVTEIFHKTDDYGQAYSKFLLLK